MDDFSKGSKALVSEAGVRNDFPLGEKLSDQANLSRNVWEDEIHSALDNLKMLEMKTQMYDIGKAVGESSAGIHATAGTNFEVDQILKRSSVSDKIGNQLFPSRKEPNFIDCQWGRLLDLAEDSSRKAQLGEQHREQLRKVAEIDLTPYMWHHSGA